MDKHELIFGPRLEVDDDLFQLAPLQTLKTFTRALNRRLIRVEVIIVTLLSIDVGARLI